MLKKLKQRLSQKFIRHAVSLKISYKWLKDSRSLPLTPDHRPLYEIIHHLCLRELGEFPNLVNCRDFNDRIQWLKLFDQDREIIRCSDKIRVRDYIRERVGDNYLNDLYQVHDHFDDIDFDALPNAFVIKVNHDSGTVILVPNKSTFDRQAAREKIEEALKRPYGWDNGEWAYSYTRPKVLVENYIGKIADRPSDYRCHCVNGKVAWVQNDIPHEGHFKEVTLSREGVPLGVHFSSHKFYSEEAFLPTVWCEMMELAERLSLGWKYVRVDLFVSQEKIFCGEMTFFPYRGTYKGDGQKIMGKLLDFDRTTYKPFLIPMLEREQSRFDLYPEA